jgi:hypothetical protein
MQDMSTTTIIQGQRLAATPAAISSEDSEYIAEVGKYLEVAFLAVSRASKASLREVLGDPASVGKTLANSLPQHSSWSERLGPMYTGSSLAKALRVSRQTISERASKRTLIALRSADDHMLYPRFQFDDRLLPIPGLSDIWRVLTTVESDEWTCASWLVAPLPRLKEKSVVAFLHKGGDIERALVEASAVTRRWAR